MEQSKKYSSTFYVCCISSVVQAFGINLLSLLFVSMQTQYSLSLSKLTSLITVTFLVQLFMDALSAKIIDKIGYRYAMISAHLCTTVGLVLLAILPDIFSNAYIGLLIATIVFSVGCGIIEVVTSPIVEALPNRKKGKLSLLHSCYCFGYVGIVLISVIFFAIFERTDWKYLCLLLAIVPFVNGICSAFVPYSTLDEQRGKSYTMKELLSNKKLYLFVLLIVCAGACEQAMCQWISYFAEKGLNIQKSTGDLIGPLTFALLMGLGRLFYGLFGHNIALKKVLPIAGIACIITYLMAVLINNPIISLIACALTGLAVSIMWPGTLDIASKNILRGGTAMFALLALGGDIGCTIGPSIVGYISDFSDYGLIAGLSVAIIFPILFFIASLVVYKKDSSHLPLVQKKNNINYDN